MVPLWYHDSAAATRDPCPQRIVAAGGHQLAEDIGHPGGSVQPVYQDRSEWQIEWQTGLACAVQALAGASGSLRSAWSLVVTWGCASWRLFMVRRRSTVRFRKGAPVQRPVSLVEPKTSFLRGAIEGQFSRHPGTISRIGKRSGVRCAAGMAATSSGRRPRGTVLLPGPSKPAAGPDGQVKCPLPARRQGRVPLPDRAGRAQVPLRVTRSLIHRDR
jgi:hypothetical protein